MNFKSGIFVTVLVSFFSCNDSADHLTIAEQSITVSELAKHIKILASDRFEGRKPFTEGERLSVNYIADEFKRIGLQPGMDDTFFQDVPLVDIFGELSDMMTVSGKNKEVQLKKIDEYIAFSSQREAEIRIEDSELVFAGYGIVAPEYGWNDYEGLDVKGKTVMVLVNDPGYGSDDGSFFKGNTMTYYGRWTYKYEEAARQGAKAILIIHQTGPAGYPWGIPRNRAVSSNMYVDNGNDSQPVCDAEGWIQYEPAKHLFETLGFDFEETLKKAKEKNFKGFSLDAAVSFSIQNRIKEDVSKNVIGIIPGTNKKEEAIVFVAHWDHLGIVDPLDGDSIINGASDNAAGIAWLLEIAEAFQALPQKPERTLIFLAVTAEEQGLRGSEWYVEHPVVPMGKTIACINTDILLFLGKFKDLTITGYGQSELDDIAAEMAKGQGRYVAPDPDPEKGLFYRSDHFSFVRKGVPSLFAKGYMHHAEKGKEWTAHKMKEYWENVYHKPRDEYDPERDDLAGLEQDTRLFFRMGYKLANEPIYPKWKDGSEFKTLRE